MRTIWTSTFGIVLLVASGGAMADWNEGDPYKMHYPQLPYVIGWKVNATTILNPDYDPTDPESPMYLQHKVVADDWLCSQSGPVTDIHFWGAWAEDRVGSIISIHLSIHEDDPIGPGAKDPSNTYSKPGDVLWSWDTAAFTVRGPIGGELGWFDPSTGQVNRPEFTYWQYNVVDIPVPFIQEEGTIYWLDITVTVPLAPPGEMQCEWGWQTSWQHWNDDAVWSDSGQGPWYELRDPALQTSLDMAFVITPEPGTLAVLAVGAVAVLRRARKR